MTARQATFYDYEGFVEKFKPKKTTDDCFTPENVYNAVRDWAVREYHLEGREIIRPFWPGADFERADYPANCVVIDNPPFSILSRIVKWFNAHKVDYFLFAPYLTNFNIGSVATNHIIAPHNVTYSNGAKVDTSFVTNLGEYIIRAAPDLMDAVKAADDENVKARNKELPKYEYPDCVISSAAVGYLAKHHTPFALKAADCVFIRVLDAQVNKKNRGIFGGGFLLSERAAAERAAAERAAAERAAREKANAIAWELSPRERELQKMLGKSAPDSSSHDSATKNTKSTKTFVPSVSLCGNNPPTPAA